MVPHLATSWAIPRLSAQIGRDAEFSGFYGRGYQKALIEFINQFFEDVNHLEGGVDLSDLTEVDPFVNYQLHHFLR